MFRATDVAAVFEGHAGGFDLADERVGRAAVVGEVRAHQHGEAPPLVGPGPAVHVGCACAVDGDASAAVRLAAADVAAIGELGGGRDLADERVDLAVLGQVGTDLHRERVLVGLRLADDVGVACVADCDREPQILPGAADVAGEPDADGVDDERHGTVERADAEGVVDGPDRRERRRDGDATAVDHLVGDGGAVLE